jgi:5-oxoprolinase (ATP-hydrolysing)
VTDANLILGRLIPDFFPALFGVNGNERLDIEASLAKFRELAHTVESFDCLHRMIQSFVYIRSMNFLEIINRIR